jgi:hypothetical protein
MIDVVQMRDVGTYMVEQCLQAAASLWIVNRQSRLAKFRAETRRIVITRGNEETRPFAGFVARILHGKRNDFMAARQESVAKIEHHPFSASTQVVEFVDDQDLHSLKPLPA